MIRLWIALALVLSGAQFTHSGQIHSALGHDGQHHGADSDGSYTGAHDHGDGASNPATIPVDQEGGAHCGAPIMAVFEQGTEVKRRLGKADTIAAANPLLTTQFNLDPPPPRA